MKYRMMMVGMAVLLLVAGCVYEAPLTEEHTITVDPALLGLWVETPDKNEDTDQNPRMMILKYSDTEYLIHYPAEKNGIYYRGYPIQIGGIACIQLKAIGTKDGPVEPDEKALYHVGVYRVTDDGLEIRLLNPDVVDDALKTTDELVQAFLEQKDNPVLFAEQTMFRRVQP